METRDVAVAEQGGHSLDALVLGRPQRSRIKIFLQKKRITPPLSPRTAVLVPGESACPPGTAAPMKDIYI